MEFIKRYQVRGVPGYVNRVNFSGRNVDFWAPQSLTSNSSATFPTQHLLIAHDGQNIFDGKTSTFRGRTWKLAQSAIRVSETLEITPPVIVAVWHSRSDADPFGRGKDLTPERFFKEDVKFHSIDTSDLDLTELRGDQYLKNIFTQYVPAILSSLNLEIPAKNSAVIGASMGGLATLYAGIQHPDQMATLLALSTHWPIGENRLVERMIGELPLPGTHKIWMSRGTKGLDRSYPPFQDYADRLMQEKGYQIGQNFVSKVYEKSGHNERSWAKYLDQTMKFWLSK
jgi:predicted alpha/beta superfamily hydrolase